MIWGTAALAGAAMLLRCGAEPGPAPSAAGPDEIVAYHRLRVEFSTTSDWSRLEILPPPGVLAARVMGFSGREAGTSMASGILALHQSFEDARAARAMFMKAEYALAPEAADGTMEFLLKRGAINASRVRVFQVAEAGEKVLFQKDHRSVDEKDTDNNPLAFSVEMASLKASPPLRSRVGFGAGSIRWEFYDPGEAAGAGRSPEEKPGAYLRSAKSRGSRGIFFPWPGFAGDSARILEGLLEAAAGEEIEIAVFFRTPGNSGGRPPEDVPFLDGLTAVLDRFGGHPAFFRLDGRPFVVVLATDESARRAWGRIASDLSARGRPVVLLAVGLRLEELETYFDPDEARIFPYPGEVRIGLDYASNVRHHALLRDEDSPPIWMAFREPRFAGRKGRNLLVWDLAF
ncbi:MAG: hypothetical protein FJY82_02340 [Candidatus Aminicenantes bacterium]|nr:hypothetical protein [Candidatus Aminicenantes bacterium]